PLVGMVAAHWLVDFPWRLAALFGALVAVTGPSVITPLLNSVRVNDRLRTTLMGEGVIIDPLGALLTLFLLQLAVAESFDPVGPTQWVIERVGIGLVAGLAGSAAVWILPRVVRRLGGHEMSLLVIAAAFATFAFAESNARESGLTAMVIMGVAVGNMNLPHRHSLLEFQESVVTFLVATVYVLLAAQVDIPSLKALWPEGALVVLALVLVGRPLLVAVATRGLGLTWREQVFLAAVAPRGVVAASLAGLVAIEVGTSLGPKADEFVGLVFLVIAGTIAVQSAYAGPLARILRVFPMRTIVVGCGETGRRLANRLRAQGEEIVAVEADEEATVEAREEGLDVVLGNAADLSTLQKAGADEAEAIFLTTPNDEQNLLIAQLARTEFGTERIFARVDNPVNVAAFEALGVIVVNPAAAIADDFAALHGEPALEDLLTPSDEGLTVSRFRMANPTLANETLADALKGHHSVLLVLLRRGSRSILPDGGTRLEVGDIVTAVGEADDVAALHEWFELSAIST
ncbi:MAG: cation:proton antiporter, partial [Dehalococcoidia bacterium]